MEGTLWRYHLCPDLTPQFSQPEPSAVSSEQRTCCRCCLWRCRLGHYLYCSVLLPTCPTYLTLAVCFVRYAGDSQRCNTERCRVFRSVFIPQHAHVNHDALYGSQQSTSVSWPNDMFGYLVKKEGVSGGTLAVDWTVTALFLLCGVRKGLALLFEASATGVT
jgi:hypothetical protein